MRSRTAVSIVSCAVRCDRGCAGPRCGTINVSALLISSSFCALDETADPAARRVVEHGVRAERHDAARHEHVALLEQHIDVAVGMGLGQMAVLYLLVADAQRERLWIGRVERFSRQGCCSARRVRAVFPMDVVPVLIQQARQLVRHDRRIGAAQRFIAAGIRRVPMRVDERLDRQAAELALDGLRETSAACSGGSLSTSAALRRCVTARRCCRPRLSHSYRRATESPLAMPCCTLQRRATIRRRRPRPPRRRSPCEELPPVCDPSLALVMVCTNEYAYSAARRAAADRSGAVIVSR